eukprot:SM000296S11291  [mRNA]  locus=s296:75636:77876:+ [translate_table: standard]
MTSTSSARTLFSGLRSSNAGLGRLLALDEFFVAPSSGAIPLPPPRAPLESLVYYLEDDDASCGGDGAWPVEEDGEDPHGQAEVQVRHGVQLYLESALAMDAVAASPSGRPPAGPGLGGMVAISHVREAGHVPELHLDELGCRASTGSGGDGGGLASSSDPTRAAGDDVEDRPEGAGGGAIVRVVAGDCCGVAAPPPLTDFVLLDVRMRPGSVVHLPVPASYAALVYILEGVGMFGGGDGSSGGDNGLNLGLPKKQSLPVASYQNEGHALELLPFDADGMTHLRVQCHPWSGLRLILIAASGGFYSPSNTQLAMYSTKLDDFCQALYASGRCEQSDNFCLAKAYL